MTTNPDGGAWPVRPLGGLVTYNVGKTPARANPAFWEKTTENVSWVTISDLPAYGLVESTKESITARAFDEVFRGALVPAGTLLMSFKLTIGKVATLGIPAVHNEAIVSIYPGPEIDQQFLAYFLSQYDYGQLQDRQIKGNTLNKEKIDRIPVPVPSLEEQRRIADLLNMVRRSSAEEAQLISTAEELKRSVSRQVFTAGVRGGDQKESEIGVVAERWDVVPLGSLGRIGNGSTPKRANTAYWSGGSFPWLNSAKVYDRDIEAGDQFVTKTALSECHLPVVEPGAVLMAITGQGKTLGNVAVLRTEATISQHLAYIQADPDRIDSSFLRGYLETQYDALRQVASGGGSTKGALTCAYLRGLPVPLPDLSEQQEIVAVLEAVERKLALHRERRTLLEQLFRTLLHQLMNREIFVDEIALASTTSEGTAA